MRKKLIITGVIFLILLFTKKIIVENTTTEVSFEENIIQNEVYQNVVEMQEVSTIETEQKEETENIVKVEPKIEQQESTVKKQNTENVQVKEETKQQTQKETTTIAKPKEEKTNNKSQEETKSNENKNEAKQEYVTTEKQDTPKQEQNTSNEKQEEQNNQQINKQETNEVVEIKEERIYNEAETKRMIADIDEIAKRNPNLWGADGEKRYKVKIDSSLSGNNYTSPYRKYIVEGFVINTFPVTFLVYAEDYKKTGYTPQTRYYIEITNY